MASYHYYHAVRGWRTVRQLRGVEVPCVADPGLLADRLLPDRASIPVKHRLGLVPRREDVADARIASLAAQVPGSVILEVCVDPVAFLRRAAECEFILADSLPGLIVADSLGIPNAWASFADPARAMDFRFLDYYSAFGFNQPRPVDLRGGLSECLLAEWRRSYQRPGLEKLKRELVASFPFPRKGSDRPLALG